MYELVIASRVGLPLLKLGLGIWRPDIADVTAWHRQEVSTAVQPAFATAASVIAEFLTILRAWQTT